MSRLSARLSQVGRPISVIPADYCHKTQRLPGGGLLVESGSSLTCLKSDGQVQWHVGESRGSSIGPQGEIVHLSGQAVAGLDPSTGEELWRFESPNPKTQLSDPVMTKDGSVLVGTSRGRAIRIEPGNPEPLSAYRLNRSWIPDWLFPGYHTGVATDDQGSVVLEGAFRMVSRSPEGKVNWRTRFSECINEPEFIRSQWVVSDNKGALHAISRDGARRWSTFERTPNGGNMYVDCLTPGPPGILYFHPTGSPLVALDENTGQELFSFGPALAGHSHYRATYDEQDGLLYVSRFLSPYDGGPDPAPNQLHVLDAQTGRPVRDPVECRGAQPVKLPGTDLVITTGFHELRVDPLYPPELPEVQTSEEDRDFEVHDDWLMIGETAVDISK